MEDPVVASDGYSYERLAIMQHLEFQGNSPMTRQEMNESQLTENRALKDSIDRWRTENQPSESVPQQYMNEEEVYYDATNNQIKFKDTDELVTSEFVEVCWNGKKYKGGLKEGLRHGKGILYYKNGKKMYEGDYSEGIANGKGIKYYKNGKKLYEGDYSEGIGHGKGIKYYDNVNNTKLYEGDYFQDRWTGKGIKYYKKWQKGVRR